MADPNSALGPLPNGWECRNDPRTRRNYFINFINKTTTWDDPRVNPSVAHAPPPYNEPTTDIFTMQPQLHGTPDHRSIYPSNPAQYHPQPAFHLPTPYIQELLRQDISSYRPSPVPGRMHTAPLMGSHAISHHNSSKIHETSFSTGMATEHSVAKISAMFPTVSESHIRALLIKYMKSMFPKADETIILDTLYNVDNNVMAATNQLQAMGFDKKDSTPSCAGTPSFKGKQTENGVKNEKKEKVVPTPSSSARLRSVVEKQEMRDRLKKIHPDLAEQLISMALDSVDYDENRASHILNMMIKDEITPKSTQPNSASSSQRPQSSNKSNDVEVSSVGTKTTVEADVAAGSTQKLTVGRETENNVSKTVQSTIEGVVNSEKTTESKEPPPEIKGPISKTVSTSATIHSPPIKSSSNETSQSLPTKSSTKKTKGKKDVPKVSRGTSTTEDKEYRSTYRIRALGPNSSLHHGPNHELLLEDYVTWAGPSRKTKDSTTTATGPNKTILSSSRYVAKGPNKEAHKGPQKKLAKGSLYSHLAACNAATTLVAVESRGK